MKSKNSHHPERNSSRIDKMSPLAGSEKATNIYKLNKKLIIIAKKQSLTVKIQKLHTSKSLKRLTNVKRRQLLKQNKEDKF